MTKKRGYVPIELGGQTRMLHFDVNALVLLEERMGMDALSVFRRPPGFRMVRECLYAGLVYGEPALTPERVGQMMDARDVAQFSRLVAAIIEAAQAALPSPDGEVSDPPTPENGA